MDKLSWAFYEQKFTVYVSQKNGNDFQDFFSTLMEKCYPGDFCRIKPWGRQGDLKCDGFWTSEEMLFQVYAPEEIGIAKTLSKISNDFSGAQVHWSGKFSKWTFVHNSPKGIPSKVKIKLIDLHQAHNILTASWGIQELWNEFKNLDDLEVISVLGAAPSYTLMREVGFEDFRLVLLKVAEKGPVADSEIQPVPMDKIEANALSDNVEMLIRAGMRKSPRVKDFLRSYKRIDPDLGDRAAEAFKKEYSSLKQDNLLPDDIFGRLLHFAGSDNDPKNLTSALAVIAYFFEECDIFERPLDPPGNENTEETESDL